MGYGNGSGVQQYIMMELKDQNETTETTSEKELGAQSLRIKTDIDHVSGYVSSNGVSKWDNIS